MLDYQKKKHAIASYWKPLLIASYVLDEAVKNHVYDVFLHYYCYCKITADGLWFK